MGAIFNQLKSRCYYFGKTTMNQAPLLHSFYPLNDAFSLLNKADSNNFRRIEDILLLHKRASFKLHVLVSEPPILVEPSNWVKWLSYVTRRAKLYEESRKTKIESPSDKQKRHLKTSSVESKLNSKIVELQKEGYSSSSIPKKTPSSLAVEISEVENLTGHIIIEIDSTKYYLINKKWYKSTEKVDIYTIDNSIIGFLKEELKQLLPSGRQTKQQNKASRTVTNNPPKLLFPDYTLDKALDVLTPCIEQIKDIDDIYRLAKQGDIQLCMHKPECSYVQIDKKGFEMIEVYCEPLDLYVVIPKNKQSSGVSTAPLFAGSKLEHYYGDYSSIYPIINSEFITEMNDRKSDLLYISDRHLKAKHNGKEISLLEVKFEKYPNRTSSQYEKFINWLKIEYPLLYEEYNNYKPSGDGTNTPRFFSTGKKDERQDRGYLIAKRKDLRITKDELERFIKSFLLEENGSIEPQQAPEPIYQPNLDTIKKSVEKRGREHQLHTLILKIDIALTNEGIRPTAQDVWNEIEKNHNEYDDEAIIQEVKDNTIFWISKWGAEQTLAMTSFFVTLSDIRKKHKNN